MLSTKTIDDKIISKLRDLPDEGKEEVLVYIDQLKEGKENQGHIPIIVNFLNREDLWKK